MWPDIAKDNSYLFQDQGTHGLMSRFFKWFVQIWYNTIQYITIYECQKNFNFCGDKGHTIYGKIQPKHLLKISNQQMNHDADCTLSVVRHNWQPSNTNSILNKIFIIIVNYQIVYVYHGGN